MNFLLISLICVAWRTNRFKNNIRKSKGWLEVNVLTILFYVFLLFWLSGDETVFTNCVWESTQCCSFCLRVSIHYFPEIQWQGTCQQMLPFTMICSALRNAAREEMCDCELTHSPDMKFVPVSVISKGHCLSFQGLLGNCSDATCSHDNRERERDDACLMIHREIYNTEKCRFHHQHERRELYSSILLLYYCLIRVYFYFCQGILIQISYTSLKHKWELEEQ